MLPKVYVTRKALEKNGRPVSADAASFAVELHCIFAILQYSLTQTSTYGGAQLKQPEKSDPETVVVTIDGPAGVGKSTVARMLAEALGFYFLDTGAMYRSVTYSVLQNGIDPCDEDAAFELASRLDVRIDGQQITVDDRDVSQQIRSPEVGLSIGRIADNVRIRKLLTKWQRQWVRGRRVVTEGRDQGSEVFCDAACKIFLVASSHERARRRQAELAAKGVSQDFETVLSQQNQRDLEDQSRPVGALRRAKDSIEFATDGLSLEAVVAEVESIVRQRLAERGVDIPLAKKEHGISKNVESSREGEVE